MIMKKNYFKPEAVVVDIVIENSILSNSLSQGDGGEIMSNRHRGEWGNVWGEK